MRNWIRYTALMMALCVIIGTVSMVRAADESDRNRLVVENYDFQNADYQTLQGLFCLDAQGFLKALAFESADTQTYVIHQLLSLVDTQTFSTVSYLLQLMRYETNQYRWTQSEKNLFAAIIFQLDYRDGLGSSPYGGTIENLLQNASQPISIDQYSNSLGAVIRDDPHTFIVQLSQLEPSDQSTIIHQIEQLNGTVRSIRPVERLRYLQQYAPGNTPPEDEQGEPLEMLTEDQAALVNTLLECLQDLPDRVDPQDPIPEELAQWQADKVVLRTNFAAWLKEIANGGSTRDLTASVMLETASFVRAFSQLEESAAREDVIHFFLNNYNAVSRLGHLLFNIHCYLTYVPADAEACAAIGELQYAALHDCIYTISSQPDFVQQFDLLPAQPGEALETYIHHLAVGACRFPYEFITAYTANPNLQGTLNSLFKAYLDPAIRQALIDTMYDRFLDTGAIKVFLAYQASTPNPMYPYGVDPNAPPATEPTDPTETTAPTEATVPTETELPAQDSSEDTLSDGNRSTRLLSTVFLCIGAFAVGVPIGIYYVNRKKQTIKEEKDAVPPPPDEEDFL